LGAILLPCEGLTVFVGVTEVQGRMIGKVEGNPSRLLDPVGTTLLPPHRIGWAMKSLWDMVDLVEPACSLQEARVKRLDLARDFVVESPAFYVRGLATVKRPYARQAGVWFSPQCGHAETLHVGCGAGMVRLYDRFAAYGGSTGVPEGGLRWEVEARSDWMQRIAGINLVADLTEHRMYKLAEDRWEWSAMGVEVVATNVAVEKVLRAVSQGRLSPTEARGFLGERLIRSCGRDMRMSKSTAAKYSRLERELEVTLAPEAQSANFFRRLDWESGTEVLRVA
jgi:hypothetical protein